ncbi:MAG: TIGR03862 family flavoprotein, partial [Pseudomonadota bacterium]
MRRVCVVGAGPAGLMAAEVLADAGCDVQVMEAKPSVGRKFLMAGKSGLNLTKQVTPQVLKDAYGGSVDLDAWLAEFGVEEVCTWAQNLGQEIFVGSSGRVFPKAMKASPLLRAWLKRLARKGVTINTRARLVSLDPLEFEAPEGAQSPHADAIILALGGGSWSKLGSDGLWTKEALAHVPTEPFGPVNVALRVAWSPHMTPHFGMPLKAITLKAGGRDVTAEAVITKDGLEGGGIYEVSKEVVSGAALHLDLMPDWSADRLNEVLAKRGKQSWGTFLRKALRWGPVKQGLFMELARPIPDN